jgi:hypothetical protein
VKIESKHTGKVQVLVKELFKEFRVVFEKPKGFPL